MFQRIGRQSGRILAVEHDGFSLRAAVVRPPGAEVVVESAAESAQVVPELALADALRQLQGPKPRRVVLLTSDVVPAVLELPLPPGSPRPWAQMQQMIRWELEPYVAQQLGPRSLSEILVCRGHLTDEQAEQIREEVQRRRQPTENAARTAFRSPESQFEELALEQEFVTPRQLEECRELQERFQNQSLGDEEFVCGWADPGRSKTSDEGRSFGAVDGQHPWLVAGISRFRREAWIRSFEENGLRLTGLYPLAGPGAAALDAEDRDRATVLFEVRPGWVGATQLRHGRVEAVRTQPVARQAVSAEQCLELMDAGSAEVIRLAGRHPCPECLRDQLAERTHRPVELVGGPVAEADSGTGTTASWAGAVGAVRHQWGSGKSAVAVHVAPHDPGPPLRQRPAVWWLSAAAGAGLILGSLETVTVVQRQDVDQRVSRLEGDLSELETAKSRIEAKIDRVEKLKASLEERRDELEDVQRRRLFLEEALPRRSRFIPAVLEALAETASDEVVVDRISETPQTGVEVEAWALSDAAAQRFVQGLQSRLRRWNLEMGEPHVEENVGRLELDGYAVKLHLMPAPSDVSSPEAAPMMTQSRGRDE